MKGKLIIHFNLWSAHNVFVYDLMCMYIYVCLYLHFFKFQTTIIWDAHTGEAKQQFPFHSGKSAMFIDVDISTMSHVHETTLSEHIHTRLPFFSCINHTGRQRSEVNSQSLNE